MFDIAVVLFSFEEAIPITSTNSLIMQHAKRMMILVFDTR